jgi:glycine dehydrogenase
MSKQFEERHVGITPGDTNKMLSTIKKSSIDELISEVIPSDIKHDFSLNIDEGLSEAKYLELTQELAKDIQLNKTYIGQGYYQTCTPSVIKRMVFENPGWYTQYTPYQAEIAQGRLEALLNFQTMVSDLTALPIANASLLDEGTAAAEAMTLMHRVRPKEKNNANTILVASDCFTQTIDIIKTRAKSIDINVEIVDPNNITFNEDQFALILQNPNTEGLASDYTDLITEAHTNNVLVAVIADILSLTLMKAPGEMGADVAVGSTQRFGVPIGFGGPHAGYFATKEEFVRKIPGRLIGVSIDRAGNRALRMALQTREQHIRKDKATSNICTAQALLAIMASFYAIYHGQDGLKDIATKVHTLTAILYNGLVNCGLKIKHSQFFDTITVELNNEEKEVIERNALAKQINVWFTDTGAQISIDETTSEDDIINLINLFSLALNKTQNSGTSNQLSYIPSTLVRQSNFLESSEFKNYHTETEMMRYIKRLENKDLSLCHSMIALGSCTMKLNPASTMYPVSLPEFALLHPFAPKAQTKGYLRMLDEFSTLLCEITQFDAFSFQPNSGAQGEYAGLLTIKNYFEATGQTHRNITLIPMSAHGTNPASAVMAGMKVVAIKCDSNGNVDIADLDAKIEKHKDNLAALMITYPSTHGVFETTITDICKKIHDAGAQVYMDGANMNAQVGLTSPGFIGADVCHLNLHKTFSIPHGGGGPGMGPIGVAKHLAAYLPQHCFTDSENKNGSVSAAPYGSPSIILISYGYVKLLGKKGVTGATKAAIFNANYIKTRLENNYTVLFKGEGGHVAHELIIDFREFKKSVGIEVEDIAKRLMDYGFHAPTMSWPVPGTIMIEPTESEGKAELDRFCDALLEIHKEIKEIESGVAHKDDNVLKNAPHTLSELTKDEWTRPYSRNKAAYPLDYVQERKFWPSVARIDQAYGDRNLICTCSVELELA